MVRNTNKTELFQFSLSVPHFSGVVSGYEEKRITALEENSFTDRSGIVKKKKKEKK